MPYTPLSRSIAGRVALVTGAASGMGRATAHLFAREGAHVALTDRSQDACDAVAREIDEARADHPGMGEVLPLALDVSDPLAIADGIDQTVLRFGALDILVNNAGLSLRRPLDAPDYDAVWDQALTVMLTAHQRLIRAALPHLRRSDAARIVNIASTEALGATPGNSPYAAAKHGVVGLTRAFATDLGPEGITVNCVCPGAIRTGITEGIPEEAKQTFARRRIALKRYGEPEEVAHATLSLCLPAASYITGAVLPVDGGLTIRNA